MSSSEARLAARVAAPRGDAITVFLVDDHTLVREGLRGLLEAQGDFTVVGEAADGREAIGRVRDLDPDVVVMDIAMPRLNGIEATAKLRAVAPRTRVVLLSAHSDDAYVERVVSLGDVGYVLKRSGMGHLFAAIRQVATGGRYFSPPISRRVRARSLEVAAPSDRAVTLTQREMEVLQLVVEGAGNKRAAFELGISVKTIEKHRQSAMRKLDLHDVTALVRYAVTAGIVECHRPDAVE
jgi:DNA-binding NarL/FixJ family response regulator